MSTTETVYMFGFSRFAANLSKVKESEEHHNLPGRAGGRPCTETPQVYEPNSPPIQNVIIKAVGADQVYDIGHPGDSGAPIFLEDGRAAGIITEVDLGFNTAGTKVRAASRIVTWLLNVFKSKDSLKDDGYSLRTWATDENIFMDLRPETCSKAYPCIPNLRIAAELDTVHEKAKVTQLKSLSNEQRARLRCPLLTAASMRDIGQASNLRRVLEDELGMTVAQQVNVQYKLAMSIKASPKYTLYSKSAAFDRAEEGAARELVSLSRKEPGIITGALCGSGMGADHVQSTQFALGNYLKYFGLGAGAGSPEETGSCPQRHRSASTLKQVKDITALLSDIKVEQVALAKKTDGSSDAGASAAALAAIVNAGDKQGVRVCPETSGWIAEFSEHEAD
jgi:hypothetical protein